MIGTNMFAYCLNNPVMYIDPSGFSSSFGLAIAKSIRTLGILGRLYLSGTFISPNSSYNDIVMLYNKKFNERKWPTGKKHDVDDFPYYRSGGQHNGTDMEGNIGDPVYAAVGGKVIKLVNKYEGAFNSSGDSSFGNYVIIEDIDGVQYYYAHLRLDSINVELGEYVIAGQKIAEIGNTGNSTGPHLHYAVRKNGNWVNPKNYLPT